MKRFRITILYRFIVESLHIEQKNSLYHLMDFYGIQLKAIFRLFILQKYNFVIENTPQIDTISKTKNKNMFIQQYNNLPTLLF